jgi:Ca-activated chloride channel family protein
MFNPQAYVNSGPDGIGVLEIVEGEGKQEARQFVPLRRTELRGEVTGPLASLRLTQVYGYSRAQCDRVLEAVYRFPLPGDAAVNGVRIQFGSVEITTELKERAEAESDYEQAKQSGRQAALLTREAPGVFTLQVAGIEPDQDVTVETGYVQLARAEGGGWSLRVPLTTAPRYVCGDETGSRPAAGQPLALLRDPGHRFSLDLTFSGAGSVQSPTHDLEIAPGDEAVRVGLREGEVVPDRDCVLTWQPGQERDRPSFHVWLHDDRTAEQLHFLALVAPPSVPDPGLTLSREVVLLVDHSGSMEGAKWEATDWAVRRFLSDLTDRDTVNVGLFHTTTRWFAPEPRRADAESVEAAIRFLEEHRDSGGTELGVALEQALHQSRSDGADARHVLVITDAQVTDEGRVLRLAEDEAGRADRRRISVLCIDAAPNSHLALELAERGGGVARFLTSNPDEEDITTALDEVLAEWAQPVLTGLELEVDRAEVRAAGRGVSPADEGRSRIDLGDLPTGRALWVAGRAPRGEAPELTFTVRESARREIKTRRLDLTRDGVERPGLKALFGARRLLALEALVGAGHDREMLADHLRRLGYDPDSILGHGSPVPPKVYAENARQDSEAALRRLLVEESLASGLISSATAFIAVRKESGKPVEETVVVANALPAGWSEEFLGLGGPHRMARVLMASMPAQMSPDLLIGSDDAATLHEDVDDTAVAFMAMPQLADDTMAYGSSPVVQARHSPSARPAHAGSTMTVLFTGVPRFTDEEAVLFDSSEGEDPLRDQATLSRLHLRFLDSARAAERVDPGLTLLLFLDDLSQPRARVRLADLIRQGGQRPLNLIRRPGQRLRIVLIDLNGVWAQNGPPIEVALE